MPRYRRAIALLLGLALVSGVVLWLIGSSFLRPSNHTVAAPPSDLPCETVRFHSGSGADIVGWFVDAPARRGAVLLLHPSGGDRTSMNNRARFLHVAGYATLRIDFRAHGESTGHERTWGWYESRDAISSVQWLRQRLPNTKIAVLGTSLGGASALLAKADLRADAIIAEAVFGDLRKAIWNRVDMRLGSFAADLLSPLLTMQVPLRTGINFEGISPIKAAPAVHCPVFIIHGEQDHHAHLEEARAIFDALPNSQKQWWQIPRAAHVDLCKFAGADYEHNVLEFLKRTGL